MTINLQLYYMYTVVEQIYRLVRPIFMPIEHPTPTRSVYTQVNNASMITTCVLSSYKSYSIGTGFFILKVQGTIESNSRPRIVQLTQCVVCMCTIQYNYTHNGEKWTIELLYVLPSLSLSQINPVAMKLNTKAIWNIVSLHVQSKFLAPNNTHVKVKPPTHQDKRPQTWLSPTYTITIAKWRRIK